MGEPSQDRNGRERRPQKRAEKKILIGGVGYHWMKDGSFGLIAAETLARCPRPPGVQVADLGYGALCVADDLAENGKPKYDTLILIAGVERGREPGRLYTYTWQKQTIDDEQLQARIFEAGAGIIDLDHLLLIADHFHALPAETHIIELEPVEMAMGDCLSPLAATRIGELLGLLRHMLGDPHAFPVASAPCSEHDT